MTDQSLQFPRFYVTAPSRCPYLAGREERKVFTELKGEDAEALNEALSRVGFRRSQAVAYRPACEGCNACISVRVIAREFMAGKSLKRVQRKNEDLEVTVNPPLVDKEQYSLLKAYLGQRHAVGGMADMDFVEYADMVQNSPVVTDLICYREPSENGRRGKLVAVALTDMMSDGLSMVYSFFDPNCGRASLGTYMILDHIDRAVRRGLRYVYLGYWIKDSAKMAYKARFTPIERLGPEGWYRFDPETGQAL